MKLFIALLIMFFNAPAIAQYNIIDYGAKNDTSRLSTDAINKAIATCNSRGGGRVVVKVCRYTIL